MVLYKYKRTFLQESWHCERKVVIIHGDKKSAKKETKFSKQNLKFLLELLPRKPPKTKGHLILYLHQFQSCQDKISNYLFF